MGNEETLPGEGDLSCASSLVERRGCVEMEKGKMERVERGNSMCKGVGVD